MGFYINPEYMAKEDFLIKYGIPCGVPAQDFNFNGDALPVCWMFNGAFTAAGVAYNKKELQAFNDPTDKRQKRWFLVKKEHLGKRAGLPAGWIENAQGVL